MDCFNHDFIVSRSWKYMRWRFALSECCMFQCLFPELLNNKKIPSRYVVLSLSNINLCNNFHCDTNMHMNIYHFYSAWKPNIWYTRCKLWQSVSHNDDIDEFFLCGLFSFITMDDRHFVHICSSINVHRISQDFDLNEFVTEFWCKGMSPINVLWLLSAFCGIIDSKKIFTDLMISIISGKRTL